MNGPTSAGSLNRAKTYRARRGILLSMRQGLWAVMIIWLGATTIPAQADRRVLIFGTPNYGWYYGCFGPASGNLVGYWDRNGLPDLYTGPVNGGVAPTNSLSTNMPIYTMWASKAGVGGRATNDWGHVDDYVASNLASNATGGAGGVYESTNDPYKVAGRAPHTNDCIGDFIGLNQCNWTNMNGECNGNINAYAFNYYETNGSRRYNYEAPTPDIQSGLKAFIQFRGYDAEVFSQVANTYPKTPPGRGFSFYDFMQYIDAGYPILMHIQTTDYARPGGYNPEIHGILGYGYRADAKEISIRDSWPTSQADVWVPWANIALIGLPANFYTRGLLIVLPKPRITSISRGESGLTVTWQGCHTVLSNAQSVVTETTHWYVVQGGPIGQPEVLAPLTPATAERSVVLTNEVAVGSLAVRGLFRVRFQDDILGQAVAGQITNKYGPTNLLFDIDLEQVRSVVSPSNAHWNLRGLEFTINATNYDLTGNMITNLDILVRATTRGGMRTGTVVDVRNNPLDSYALTNQIPALSAAGATVLY